MAKLDPLVFNTQTNDKTIHFRHIAPSDAEALLVFRKQIPHESTNTMQYVGQTYPPIEEIRKRLADAENDRLTLNIGAFDGERLIGHLNIRSSIPDHPWVEHLGQFGMMILKDYWGMGLGKKLLVLQETHAKALGITRIEAMVRVSNERGVKLYERAGYKIEGTRRRAAKINGTFHDEYYIAKLLDDALECMDRK